MNTEKKTHVLVDNDSGNSERITTIRATVGALNAVRITASKLSSQVGRVLLTDQDRLLFLVEWVEENAAHSKTVVQ